MKNGLPSVSRCSAWAKCVGGVRPSQRGDHRGDLAAVKAPEAAAVRAHRSRRRSASSSSQRLAELRLAVGADDQHAVVWTERTRWVSSRAVGLSAQCRSSSSSTTGHERDACASREPAASNSRNRWPSGSPPSARRSSGSRRASSGTSRASSASRGTELVVQHLRRDVRGVPTERLDERLVGDQHLLVAAAEQHRRALAMGARGRTRRRAASCRCPARRRSPRAGRRRPRLRPRGFEPAERVLASDERAARRAGSAPPAAAAVPRRRRTRTWIAPRAGGASPSTAPRWSSVRRRRARSSNATRAAEISPAAIRRRMSSRCASSRERVERRRADVRCESPPSARPPPRRPRRGARAPRRARRRCASRAS